MRNYRRYPAPGHTYHVDATAGADTNTGQADKPFQTIAAVNALALKPGDRVLFKRGETWSATDLAVSYSGQPGRPVTFGAYGSGARPILTAVTEQAIKIDSRNWVVVSGLACNGGTGGGAKNFGLKITGTAAHITVEDCDCYGSLYGTIFIGESSGAQYAADILIDRCLAHNGAEHGVISQSEDTYVGPTRLTIRGCTAYSNGTNADSHHGIYLKHTTDSVVEDCTCYSNAGAGLKFNSMSDALALNTVGRRNYLYSNGHWGIYAAGQSCRYENNLCVGNDYGIAAILEGANSLFYHNAVINNPHNGVNTAADSSGLVFKNNLVFQDQAIVGDYCEPFITSGATGVTNNTWDYNCWFYAGVVGPDWTFNVAGGKTLAQWKAYTGSPDANGINADPLLLSSIHTTVDADSAAGQTVLNVASTAGFNPGDVVGIGMASTDRREKKTIATVQAGVSLTMTANLDNTHTGAQADIVFSSVYTDLHLQTTSPAKNAGATGLGVTQDYDQNVRPYGAAPDMGAYEFQGA